MKRHPTRRKRARQVQAQAWTRAVAREIGCTSAYQLERYFRPRKTDQDIETWNSKRSRIWDQRWKGEGGLPRPKSFLTLDTHVAAPKSAVLLHRPIWTIAEHDELPYELILPLVMRLPDDVKRHMLSHGTHDLLMPNRWILAVMELSTHSSLDAVAGLLILSHSQRHAWELDKVFEIASRAFSVFLRAAAFDLDGDSAEKLADLLFDPYRGKTIPPEDKFLMGADIPWIPLKSELSVRGVVADNKRILGIYQKLLKQQLARRFQERFLAFCDSAPRSSFTGKSGRRNFQGDSIAISRSAVAMKYIAFTEAEMMIPYPMMLRPWWMKERPAGKEDWNYYCNGRDDQTFDLEIDQLDAP